MVSESVVDLNCISLMCYECMCTCPQVLYRAMLCMYFKRHQCIFNIMSFIAITKVAHKAAWSLGFMVLSRRNEVGHMDE